MEPRVLAISRQFSNHAVPANFTHSNNCDHLVESSSAADNSSRFVGDSDEHSLDRGHAVGTVNVEGGGGALQVEPVEKDGGSGDLVSKVRGCSGATGGKSKLIFLASHVGAIEICLIDGVRSSEWILFKCDISGDSSTA